MSFMYPEKFFVQGVMSYEKKDIRNENAKVEPPQFFKNASMGWRMGKKHIIDVAYYKKKEFPIKYTPCVKFRPFLDYQFVFGFSIFKVIRIFQIK